MTVSVVITSRKDKADRKRRKKVFSFRVKRNAAKGITHWFSAAKGITHWFSAAQAEKLKKKKKKAKCPSFVPHEVQL
jgi:hypothetical protein